MATDVERLIVRLEASASAFEKEMKRAARVGDQRAREIERRFEIMASTSSAAMAQGASRLASTLATALSVRQVVQYADAWQAAANKIKATGLDDIAAEVAQNDVSKIAERARTDFSATADLYARLLRASKEFGGSQRDVATATEVVSKALRITGASASETESTLIQLGQALTSGRLQGDELRSLSENAPVVTQAIAKAFGVMVGQLKDLGAEGKLTSDKVFKAIVDAAPEVEKAFGKTIPTIAESFKRLESAAIRFVGTSGQMSAAAGAVSAVINGLATNFDALAAGAVALGTVLAARLAAAGLSATVAGLTATLGAATGAAGALGAFSVAATGAGVASGAAAVAMRAFGGALALAGGPVGAALLGLAAVIGIVTGRTAEASGASKLYADKLAEVESRARGAAAGVESLKRASESEFLARAQRDSDELVEKFLGADRAAKSLEKALSDAARGIERLSASRISADDKKQVLEALKEGMAGNAEAALKAKEKLETLGQTSLGFNAAFGDIGAMLSRLAQLRNSATATQNALASIADSVGAFFGRKVREGVPAPAVSYDEAAGFAQRDDVLKRLTGQGIARRAKIDAEMDETAKKYRDKEQELRDLIQRSGGVAPDDLQQIARGIVDAEASKKGGSGDGRKQDDFQREITNSGQRVLALQRERDALGLTAFEAARAEEAHRLYDAAKQAGIPITEETRRQIEGMATAYASAKLATDRAKESQKGFNDLVEFAGNNISSFFSDMVSGGKNASDAIMNLAKRLADAAFQAALLGKGPLAQLFGMAAPSGGTGGLFGALFGGFGRFFGGGASVATGAPLNIIPPGLDVGTSRVPRDMVAQIHEGEMVIPKYDADLIRNGGLGASGASRLEVSLSPDLQARILDEARGQSIAVTQRGIAAYDRQLPGKLEEQRIR